VTPLTPSRVRELYQAQGAFYAGVPDSELRELLTEDVVWHVPGRNAIAGSYEGIEAVMGYFAPKSRPGIGNSQPALGDGG